MLFDFSYFDNIPFSHLEEKHGFELKEYYNDGSKNGGGSSNREQTGARLVDLAKKSGIFKQSPDKIKEASRKSLPQGREEAKPARRKSTEAEKEAKRAAKAARNKKKANAAKRRG